MFAYVYGMCTLIYLKAIGERSFFRQMSLHGFFVLPNIATETLVAEENMLERSTFSK